MKRLDPRCILISAVEYIKQFLFPIIISIISGSRRSDNMFWIVFGIPAMFGVFAILFSVWRYYFMRYGVIEGALKIQQGLIWKGDRTIPLERIQNVTVRQNFFERILNIGTVAVETAGGAGEEAKLTSLSMTNAEELRHLLLGSKVEASETESDETYRVEIRDLALAGALQNRALYLIGLVLGFANDSVGDLVRFIANGIKRIPMSSQLENNPIWFVIAFTIATLVFLLIGWIASMLMNVIQYYNFTVSRTERGLSVQYGSVSTYKASVPIKKIQSIQTAQPWLFRVFGLSQLRVSSIGGGAGPNPSEAAVSGSILLAPICRPTVLRRLSQLVFNSLQLDELKYFRVDPSIKLRKLIGLTLFIFIAGSLIAITHALFHPRLFSWIGYSILVVVYFVGIWNISRQYQRMGVAVTPDFVVLRTGVIGEFVTIIPRKNVQTIDEHNAPFLNRRALRDLTISTPVNKITIPCLPKEYAAQLREFLMDQKSHTGL